MDVYLVNRLKCNILRKILKSDYHQSWALHSGTLYARAGQISHMISLPSQIVLTHHLKHIFAFGFKCRFCSLFVPRYILFVPCYMIVLIPRYVVAMVLIWPRVFGCVCTGRAALVLRGPRCNSGPSGHRRERY